VRKVDLCEIAAAIEETAPALKRAYPGRVVYVTKDRESRAKEAGEATRARAVYRAAAKRCGVHVHVVERLPDEGTSAPRRSHAGLGRDDFYLITLAQKFGCPVLTRDRFRDLAEMKSELRPFHVYCYSPHRDWPSRDFVNPAAAEYRRLQRPAAVDYDDVLPAAADKEPAACADKEPAACADEELQAAMQPAAPGASAA
jgi:hypothetical protein